MLVFRLACAAVLLAAAPPPEAVHDLAPDGSLRVAINFGNPVLAHRDAAGAAHGVSVDLARELGRQIGMPVTLVPFDEAGQVFEAAKTYRWDVAFLAADPVRAAQISFTAPYVLIEGSYAVPAASPFHDAAEVDRNGVRIAVAEGSAYDLYLTRTLRHATLIREQDTAHAVAAFLRDSLEVLAGVRQPLVKLVARHPDTRLLEGRFMIIPQAIGTPQGHPAGAAFLDAFVAQAKANGFVAQALRTDGQEGVTVAGP